MQEFGEDEDANEDKEEDEELRTWMHRDEEDEDKFTFNITRTTMNHR